MTQKIMKLLSVIFIAFYFIMFIESNLNAKNIKKYEENSGNFMLTPANGTGHYIRNRAYFDCNPYIGDNTINHTYGNNNSGTCGVIAAQLLLGYHNYYNDRRIIDNRYLLGGFGATDTYPNINPNTCIDPMLMNQYTVSTNYSSTDSDSFYLKLIATMMEPNERGLYFEDLLSGLDYYLQEQNLFGYTINSREISEMGIAGGTYISPNLITNEIDNGNPIILSTSSTLGYLDHFVVCYGYEIHNINGVNTLGYVINNGWYGSWHNEFCWVNASHVDGYISLNMNHTHKYRYYCELNDRRNEYRCTECGHRTDSAIDLDSDSRYTEHRFYLEAGETKEIYVSCFRNARYLVQTFGSLDAYVTLVDEYYNTITYNDDSGYGTNSLFNYTFNTNDVYKILLRFYNEDDEGYVKIGSCCSIGVINNYSNIPIVNTDHYYFWTNPYMVEILRFIPSESGTYQIQTIFIDNTEGEYLVDNVLYYIIPTSTDAAIFDDEGAQWDAQARITVELTANCEYIFIISQYYAGSGTERVGIDITRLI